MLPFVLVSRWFRLIYSHSHLRANLRGLHIPMPSVSRLRCSPQASLTEYPGIHAHKLMRSDVFPSERSMKGRRMPVYSGAFFLMGSHFISGACMPLPNSRPLCCGPLSGLIHRFWVFTPIDAAALRTDQKHDPQLEAKRRPAGQAPAAPQKSVPSQQDGSADRPADDVIYAIIRFQPVSGLLHYLEEIDRPNDVPDAYADPEMDPRLDA